MRRGERTVVLVTHDMTAVQHYCHRAMLLDEGRLRYIGDPEEAGRQYLRMNFAKRTAIAEAREIAIVPDFLARVIDAWLEDERRRADREHGGRRADPAAEPSIEARQDLSNPAFTLQVNNADGVEVFKLGAAVAGARGRHPDDRPGRAQRSARRSRTPCCPGATRSSAGSACSATRRRSPSSPSSLLEFVVFGVDEGQGLVSVPGEIDVVIEGAGATEGRTMSAEAEQFELRPVQGPSALGGGWKRFGELLYLVSVTEFKRTYFGTVLGYVWALLRPLLLFAVLLFVFTKIFRLGSSVPHYPVLLLMNVVLFGFFSEATGTSVMSVVSQEGVVRKTQFPRLVIPLSVVVTCLFNLAINLIVVVVFLLAFGLSPQWTWFLFPLVILALFVYATAVSMLLSSLYVRFRDTAIIWSVVATALFYATPVLYTIEVVPSAYRNLILLNPLTSALRAGP